MNQLDLQFPSAPTPIQDSPEAELIIAFLNDNPGFHTAKEITTHLNLSDRQIRKSAEYSNGLIVSGPGSPGYCHINHCPLETLNHIRNTIRSQARHMLNRYLTLGKVAHQTIR